MRGAGQVARSRKAREVRAVIYLNGNEAEMKLQFELCQRLCDRRRYRVVGICRETGDGVAWIDAQILKRSNLADKIVLYSIDSIPSVGIESVTGELPHRPEPTRAATPRTRRPRPIR